MIPSAADLYYFSEVAHTLNISRAAERLGISQPSLSLAMQRLEHEFGVPLLIRSKTGVQLTKGGQRLLGKVRILLDHWEQLRGDALRDEKTVTGHFTLGMHPSVGLYSLRHFLPQLMQEHPDLQFKLVHDLSRKISEDVISFKVDFGIVVNPPQHPDLVIKNLFKDSVSFYSSPALKNPDVLICDTQLVQVDNLLKKMTAGGLEFRRVVTSTSLEVIADLCAAGAGVAILPQRVAEHYPQYKLKVFSTKAPQFADQICLIYRVEAQQSVAAKKIIQSLHDWAKESSARK